MTGEKPNEKCAEPEPTVLLNPMPLDIGSGQKETDRVAKGAEEKTVVLDRVTSENTSEYSDFVTCNNCGKVMLVNQGEETCPYCDCEGTLSWTDEKQEILYEKAEQELSQMGYMLCDLDS